MIIIKDANEVLSKFVTNLFGFEDIYIPGKKDSNTAYRKGLGRQAHQTLVKIPKYYEIENSYDRVRDKVVHEDNLVNQRLTWFIALNGFIFAALSFSLSAEGSALSELSSESDTVKAKAESFINRLHFIRLSLFSIGLGSSLATLLGIFAAYRRISHERINFHLYLSYVKGVIGKSSDRRELIPWLPRLTGYPFTNSLGMLSGLILPILIGAAWWVFGFSMTDLEAPPAIIFITNIILFGAGVGLIVGLYCAWHISKMHRSIVSNDLDELY